MAVAVGFVSDIVPFVDVVLWCQDVVVSMTVALHVMMLIGGQLEYPYRFGSGSN